MANLSSSVDSLKRGSRFVQYTAVRPIRDLNGRQMLTACNPGSSRPTPPSTWAFRSRGAGIRLPCPEQERTAARWAACWRGTISIIRWRYVGWSAGGACESFEDESQGCVSWLPRSCRLLVPGGRSVLAGKALEALPGTHFRPFSADTPEGLPPCYKCRSVRGFKLPAAALRVWPEILFNGGYQLSP